MDERAAMRANALQPMTFDQMGAALGRELQRIAKLEAENARLRAALTRVTEVGDRPAVIVAREALGAQ